MASPHSAQHPAGMSRTSIPAMWPPHSRTWLLAEFKKAGREVNYPRGSALFREDEMSQEIFIVNSGLIKLSLLSREGRKIIVRVAEARAVLGLNAALAQRGHEVTAEVVENASVRVIPVWELVSLLQIHPYAARAAMRLLLEEYDAVFSDIRRFTLPTVAGRLASLLLSWLEERRQKGHEESRIIVLLTHEELACMVGTSRETVSRVLQQFRREQLIAIKGSCITILRQRALEELV